MSKQSIQLNLIALDPVLSNQKVDLDGSAIIIKNAGDVDVTINNFWRLPAGESLEIGSSEDTNVVSTSIFVKFDPATEGIDPYIQIMELKPALPGFANYIQE